MKKYGLNELRQMYLDFFKEKNHLILPSFSLVPQNDKSLLLIPAGMAPLKPYFTGQEIPPSKRIATCQKCIRTTDIENIGKTARHGTFFEMLGNFSFGDYFKEDAIKWSWEFLTERIGLNPDDLYPSVYEKDDEAYDIWKNVIGISPERIYKFGKEDNFWEHGAGPCGPSSEIYYDRGEKYGCGKPDCTVGCECIVKKLRFPWFSPWFARASPRCICHRQRSASHSLKRKSGKEASVTPDTASKARPWRRPGRPASRPRRLPLRPEHRSRSSASAPCRRAGRWPSCRRKGSSGARCSWAAPVAAESL